VSREIFFGTRARVDNGDDDTSVVLHKTEMDTRGIYSTIIMTHSMILVVLPQYLLPAISRSVATDSKNV
jgi:hypothetical protein